MKGIRITLTIPVGIGQALREQAKREGRSVASLAAWLLEKAARETGTTSQG